jgi:alpha-beta hydrolase superfamily lysophospholipase
VIENSADDAVPQPHPGRIFAAASSPDKRFELIKGATHYYAGQPDLIVQVTRMTLDWLADRNLFTWTSPSEDNGD